MEAIEIGIYPKGTVTAAYLGDSWTLGGGIATGKTFLTDPQDTSC